MSKKFFHFGGGVTISDSEINGWLRSCRDMYLEGYAHWNISSGDTQVIMRTYAGSGQVDFIVANSCGYSEIKFYGGDLNSLHKWNPDYVRPEPVKELNPITVW